RPPRPPRPTLSPYTTLFRSRRHFRLLHQAGELVGAEGRFLTGLDDNGVAGKQRRGHLAHDHEEWEVPRQDAGHHAQRPTEQEHVLPRPVAADDLALDAAGPLGVVIQVFRRQPDLQLGQGQYLALLPGNDLRDVRRRFADTRSDTAQILRPGNRRLRGPGILRRPRRADGCSGQLAAGIRRRAQALLGGRVDNLDGVAAALDKAAVDIMLEVQWTGHE